MSEKLDLPKPAQETANATRTHRRIAGAGKDIARELGQMGTRLERDGLKYVGSFVTHIYSSPIDGGTSYEFLSATSDLTPIPQTIALEALKQLGRAVMVEYGLKPPSKRGDIEISG